MSTSSSPQWLLDKLKSAGFDVNKRSPADDYLDNLPLNEKGEEVLDINVLDKLYKEQGLVSVPMPR